MRPAIGIGLLRTSQVIPSRVDTLLQHFELFSMLARFKTSKTRWPRNKVAEKYGENVQGLAWKYASQLAPMSCGPPLCASSGVPAVVSKQFHKSVRETYRCKRCCCKRLD